MRLIKHIESTDLAILSNLLFLLYLEMTASSIINVTNVFVTVSEEHILTIFVWKLVF